MVLNNDVAKFFQQCLDNHRLLMCTMAALLAQTHLHQNQMISHYDEGLTPRSWSLCAPVNKDVEMIGVRDASLLNSSKNTSPWCLN